MQVGAVLVPFFGAGFPAYATAGRLRSLRRRWSEFVQARPGIFEAYVRDRLTPRRRSASTTLLDSHVASRLRFAGSCRSPLSRTKPRKRAYICGFSGICPFCWMRSAGEVWDRVADLVAPRDPETRRRSPAGGYDMILTSRSVVLSDAKMADLIRERVGGTKYAGCRLLPPRRCEMRGLDFVAAYEVLTFRPEARKGRDEAEAKLRVVATVRQLFVVREGGELGPFRDDPAWPKPAIKRVSGRNLRKIQWAVAILCRYPASLLKPPAEPAAAREHAKAVSAYLNARRPSGGKGVRLWAAYGAFRRPSSVD
ncbi:MAG: hypothetical protein BGO49_00695 [Planctomycetales bacterium 71-10]|nr:MAG: hypothetical protein BGO49_00695 [Planctomycetales bacterium 71-10]